jgi:hypothetical protein
VVRLGDEETTEVVAAAATVAEAKLDAAATDTALFWELNKLSS